MEYMMVAKNKRRLKEIELIHENLHDVRVEVKKEKKGPERLCKNQQMVKNRTVTEFFL
jgi:hypothetical protein